MHNFCRRVNVLVLLVILLLPLLLSACTQSAPGPNSVEQDLARYRALLAISVTITTRHVVHLHPEVGQVLQTWLPLLDQVSKATDVGQLVPVLAASLAQVPMAPAVRAEVTLYLQDLDTAVINLAPTLPQIPGGVHVVLQDVSGWIRAGLQTI